MSNFDFENFNPVGFVNIYPNGHAYIEIVGYLNYHNNYISLNSEERIQMFPPKGRVFAHNFMHGNYKLDKRLVCLSVMPSNKEDENNDVFIWNKAGSVYEFGDRIITIKASLNEDGENNFIILQENDLIETDEDKYVLSGDKIFFIKANSKERLIPYWKISNVDVIKTSCGDKYIAAFQLPEKDGVIDITNDDQLINWFMSKILNKHWTEIMAAKSYESVEQYLINVFNDMRNITPNVYKSRLERLKRLNTNFIITLDELQGIAEIPWVKNVIEKTVEANKQSLIVDVSAEYKQQLDTIKEEHDMMLEIEKERYEDAVKQQKQHYESTLQSIAEDEVLVTDILNDKKREIEILDETIVSKNDEIAKIEELVDNANLRKDSLMSDFAIIKEVLGIGFHSEIAQANNLTTSTCATLNIQSVNEANSECMMFEAFGKSLEEKLKQNNLAYQNASTIAETLAAYNILIMPEVIYAMSIIHATQKCYYAVEYVNVGWKSFDNLWNEGLHSMIEHCKKESGIMHYLILQNINLTYLPNYLQPLLDIQQGITNCLPSGEEYPANLRILCTILNEDVIPLSEQCIRYIGCLKKPSKEVFVGRFNAEYNPKYGYLSPSKLAERASASPQNFYKSYLDE